MESYKKSQAKFIFSNGTRTIDLTDLVNGDVVFRGNTNTIRGKKQNSDAQTADCIEAGYMLTLPMYLEDPDAKDVTNSKTGSIMFVRTDCDFGYAFDCVVKSVNITLPFGGFNTAGVSFTQRGFSVQSQINTSGGSLQSGQTAYVYDGTDLTKVASGLYEAGTYIIVSNHVVSEVYQ